MLIYKHDNKKQSFFKAFALSAIVAILMMVVKVVMGEGIMFYAGDFNAQQIPFNYYVTEYLQNGGGTFSWQTDLGSSFINSYSFYVLGSPFYWLVSWVPASIFPYLMYPLLVLKFAVMAGGAYLWAEKYVEDDTWAIVVALLFSFSGYGLINIFFNHFIDVMALFPYLIWALDETVLNNKRGWFAFFVALNFLVNYFFFFGEVVFLIIYYIVHCKCKTYKIDIKKFFQLAFESLLGCMMACILVVPAYFSLTAGSRMKTFLGKSIGMLVYTYGEHYLALLMNMFLAPAMCFSNSIFTGTTISWTSMSLYIPGISMAGVIAYFIVNKEKNNPWKNIFVVSLVFMFVPLLNTSFTLFNNSYYARWFYMPLLIMCLMTVKALETQPEVVEEKLGYILAGAVVFAIALFTLEITQDFLLYGVIFVPTILCAVKVWTTFRFHSGSENFANKMLYSVMTCCVLFGFMHVYLTGQHQTNAIQMSNVKNSPELAQYMPDSEVDYRTDFYSTILTNPNLYSGLQSVKCFNSTVEPSIIDFYDALDIDRKTRWEDTLEQQAILAFLNTKYTIINHDEYDMHMSQEGAKDKLLENKENIMSDKKYTGDKAGLQVLTIEDNTYYNKYDTWAHHDIYENLNYAGIGFTFDSYILDTEYEGLETAQKRYALLKTVVLSQENIDKYGYLFEVYTGSEKFIAPEHEYTDAAMLQDINKLKENTATEFKTDNHGFSAKINVIPVNKNVNKALVVFSVPYSENWNITSNGEEIEYIKVDNGMLGLILPEGDNVIRADYVAKGEVVGRYITCAACAIFLIYVLYILIDKRRHPELPEIYNVLDEAIEELERKEASMAVNESLEEAIGENNG